MPNFMGVIQRVNSSQFDNSSCGIISQNNQVSYTPNYKLGLLGENEVKIRPLVVGVCGTDIKILNNQRLCVDGPIGHEATAVITEVGKAITSFKTGDFVVVSPHIAEERNGSFYNGNIGYSEGKGILIKEQILDVTRILKIDTQYYDKHTADSLTQTDGLACCIRSQKVLNTQKGMRGVVLGAGAMGMLHAQLLQSKGVEVTLVDINPKALEVARKIGVGKQYYSFEKAAILKESLDIVIVANGDPRSYLQAIELVKSKGQVNAFASMFNKQRIVKVGNTEVDVITYHLEERKPETLNIEGKKITFSGALGYREDEFKQAYQLLVTRVVDPSLFVTTRLSLNANTIEEVIQSYSNGGKILIYPYYEYFH